MPLRKFLGLAGKAADVGDRAKTTAVITMPKHRVMVKATALIHLSPKSISSKASLYRSISNIRRRRSTKIRAKRMAPTLGTQSQTLLPWERLRTSRALSFIGIISFRLCRVFSTSRPCLQLTRMI
jgi:DNA-binding transcriptional regulator YiaG